MKRLSLESEQSTAKSDWRLEGSLRAPSSPSYWRRGAGKGDGYSHPITTSQLVVWLAIMVGATALFLDKFHLFQVGTYRDDASYVVLAQSLVQSDRYGLINVPGQRMATNFPFGFPLLLAPELLLFHGNLDALKAVSLLATLVNGSLLFWGWRCFSTHKSHWWGLAVSAAYLLSPLTVSHTGMIMSEPAFTTFCLIALMLAGRSHRTRWWSLGTSAALAAALVVKTVGVVLVLVVFFYLFLQEGRRAGRMIAGIALQMALLIGMATALTPVEWQQLLPVEYLRSSNAAFLRAPMEMVFRSSGDEMSFREPSASSEPVDGDSDLKTPWVIDMLRYGVKWHLGRDVPSLVVPIGDDRVQRTADSVGLPFVVPFGRVLVSVLVFIGFVRWFARDRHSVFALFGAVYLAALFFWTWDGLRLLYPIGPQLQFGLLLGLEAAVGAVPRLCRPWGLTAGTRASLLSAMVLALIALSCYKSLRIDDSRLHAGDVSARTVWLNVNAPATAVFATEEPNTDFLYGKRSTVPYPPSVSDSSALYRYLADRGAGFVLVAPALRWYGDGYHPEYSEVAKKMLSALTPLTTEGRVALVHSSSDNLIRVYEVR